MQNHLDWYNCEAQTASVIAGVVVGMEEERAVTGKVSADVIRATKASLQGPVAGIGDSVVQGTLIPLLLGIGVSLTQSTGVLGPLFYIFSYLAIIVFGSHILFNQGYRLGRNAMATLTGGALNRVIEAFMLFGTIVVGALGANYVKATTAIQWSSGESVTMLQNVIDGIFPKLLSLGVIMLCYWLGKKKKNEYLLATSFQTGNTRVVYRFKKDIQTGSLTVPQSGSIGVVAKNPSGVIYLDAITAEKPKISFVVGKKAAWKKVTAKKKINNNKKFTGWNTKESMLLSQENETIPAMLVQEENQYLAVEWQADVAKKTVQKKASATAVEAKSGSLLQKCGNNYVIVCGRAGTYLEMGTDGKAIRRYNYGSGLDSVQKLTLSGMYFYGI